MWSYIQYELERVLEETLTVNGAKNRVAGIVMDVNTGGILAMATVGGYDLNAPYTLTGYYQDKLDQTGFIEGTDEYSKAYYEQLYTMWNNKAVTELYEPGSTFKIITSAMSLELGTVTTHDEFTCNGSYQIGVDTVTCDGKHGKQDLKQAFRNSCNSAFAQLAQQLGADTLTSYVQQFGITESVAFDGITTAKGNFDLTDAAGVNVAWSSIGQYTDLVNPCAYLTFVGAVAAGGKGVLPHLVQKASSGGIAGYTASAVKASAAITASTGLPVASRASMRMYAFSYRVCSSSR